MSHNPHASDAREFHLRGHEVLAIRGRDALAFAQAQFMNDLALLGDAQWHWNGWLTPKGRVIALFALLRLDAETAWLVLPDAGAADLASKLQRFVFRSKLTLDAREDLHASGRFAPPATASGSAAGPFDGGMELDLGGDGGPRCLRIGTTQAAPDAALADAWRAFDLQHGLPRLQDDAADAWTPQQLSLERLGAFSVKKGCYPGQEIVARTHFLGKAKRGLMRLRGAGVGTVGEVTTGAPIDAGEEGSRRAIGQVICAEGDEGLAVMPIDAGDGPFASGGQPCTRLPLLDGLAR